MELAKVNAAAVAAYQEAGLDLPTAYEGFPFTPPDATPWARLFWLPVRTDSRLQTADKYTGILQIDLNFPLGLGTRAAHDGAQALLDHFRPYRTFAYDTVILSVRSREPSSIRNEGGWQTVTVSVTFATAMDRAFP